jgi:hypothetical protein
MIRPTGLIAILVFAAACQPQKTPEQIAAEQQAAAMQEFAKGMASAFGQTGPNGEKIDPNAMAAAIAQAGAMASVADPNMSAEDRAKLQAITGAMASGQVHPAASAWLAGANKTVAILSNVKDVAAANAAKAQLAPIYAEMAGPAAVLSAMSEDQRDVAMGSALPQFMSMGVSMASLMIPLSSNPDLAEAVENLLDEMPSPD